MCTVTFFPGTKDGYILSMNRDELKTRAPGLPPEARTNGNVRYICPVDGNEKGTWIGVNEYHVALCLVNWFQAYDPETDQNNYRTRGEIIPGLLSNRTLAGCENELTSLQLNHYRPFRLLGFQDDPFRVLQWKWNGSLLEKIEEAPQANIWTSSGFDWEHVHQSRRKIFKKFHKMHPHPTVDQVRELHASTEPKKGIYSIAMWHDLAQSVSNTIIDATGDTPVMHYIDGYPAGFTGKVITATI